LSAIRAIGLSKRYGDTLALDALDLEVREGEVYGYLGPNGAARPRRSGSCWACTGRAAGARSSSASTPGPTR
jgi:ABC-type lipopolysaccharide export system ATPase subunit